MNPASFPEFLKIEVNDGVALLTFNRPDNENRHSGEEMGSYFRFLREADVDPSIRVIMQTGAGREWFSGGGIQGRLGSEDFMEKGFDDEHFFSGLERGLFGVSWFRDLLELKKPLITVLNGNVQGAPLTFALVSDIIIAEHHVRMRDLHVPYGMSSSTGPMLWPMATGLVKAKRWVLTGDWIDATEAEKIGLLTEVVDSGAGLERGRLYASRLASLRPEAVWITKRNFNTWLASRNLDLWSPAVLAQFAAAPRSRAK